MNETLFYVLGASLAVLAVLTTFVGLRVQSFPATRGVMVATIVIFGALVGATTTYAVINGQHESEHRAEELEKAGEEAEAEEAEAEAEGPAAEGEEEAEETAREAEKAKEGAAQGGTSTVKLAADPSEIAYDTTELSAEAGEVTIEFTNPAPIEHDVAIEEDGTQLAKSKTITESKTSVSVDLEAGDYTFLCTVPGHAEAGMEGTLTVR
jgi:plastocyanin